MLNAKFFKYQERKFLVICAGLLLVIIVGVILALFPYTWGIAALAGIGMTFVIIARPTIGLYILCFVVPLAYFQSTSSMNFVKVIGWVVAISWLLYKVLKRRQLVLTTGFRWLAALCLIGAISILWTEDKISALIRLTTLLQLLAFYMIVIDLANSRERIWRVLVVTSLGAIVASVGAVWLTLSSGNRLLSLVADISPNLFPGLLAFSFGIALSLWLTGISSLGRIGVLGLLFVSVLPVMLAGSILGSISMIAAALIAVLLAPIVTGRKRHSLSFLLAIAVLGVIASAVIYESIWWERIELAYEYGNSAGGLIGGRRFLWPAMFYRWIQRPLFGWGLAASSDVRGLDLTMETFGLSDPLGFKSRDLVNTHSVPLWAAVEFGIIGLALLLVIYLVHLGHLVEVIRTSIKQNELSTQIGLALVVITIVIFILSLGETVIFRRFFWLSLALVEAAWMIGVRAKGQNIQVSEE